MNGGNASPSPRVIGCLWIEEEGWGGGETIKLRSKSPLLKGNEICGRDD